MKVTGYIRISTSKQNNEHWKIMLSEYAEGKGIEISLPWVEETVSGAKSWKERKLASILKNSERGDILIVGEASRIGRDAADAMDFIKEARKKGLIVHIIQAGLIVTEEVDAVDPATIILPTLFAVAEYERKVLSLRTKSGLRRAKAQGKKLGGDRTNGKRLGGRTTHEVKHKVLKALKAGGSVYGLADRYNVSRTSIYKWKKEAEQILDV